MGYVLTPQELEEWGVRIFSSARGIMSEGVSMPFTTEPDFVEHVLPPCLKPAPGDARGQVNMWKCFGDFEAFDVCEVSLAAQFRDIVGMYQLLFLVSGDMPVTVGRELWGEAKKRGEVHFAFEGTKVRAGGDRHGMRLVEIEADVNQPAAPDEEAGRSTDIQIKTILDPSGMKLHFDPRVLTSTRAVSKIVARTGTGTLTLKGTERDPIGEIPIRSTVGEVIYSVARIQFVDHKEWDALAEGGERDDYVPYVIGRNYDWVGKSMLVPEAPFLSAEERGRINGVASEVTYPE